MMNSSWHDQMMLKSGCYKMTRKPSCPKKDTPLYLKNEGKNMQKWLLCGFADYSVAQLIWCSTLWKLEHFISFRLYEGILQSWVRSQWWLPFLISPSKKRMGMGSEDGIMLIFVRKWPNCLYKNKYIVNIICDIKERMFSYICSVYFAHTPFFLLISILLIENLRKCDVIKDRYMLIQSKV